MNLSKTDFYAAFPLFGGFANYLDKKELLQDFDEKIAGLLIDKRIQLDGYFQIFDEYKIVRLKRATLMQLYLKIARCVFYCNALHRRVRELYLTVTPQFFAEHEMPDQAHEIFQAIYYLLSGQVYSWDEIQSMLKTEEFINRMVTLNAEDVTDERTAFLKERYFQKPEFKSSIAVLPTDFYFVRVLMEWLIARVLFRDYPDQMKEIDELILKVNEEKSKLETEEIETRSNILDIANHIDSLVLKQQQFQEEVDLAMREESARDSIGVHLNNDFEGDYDISEILTRRVGLQEPTEIKQPSTITLASESNQDRAQILRNKVVSETGKLPTTFKLETIMLTNDYDGTISSVSQDFKDKPVKTHSLVGKKKSDPKDENWRLHQELEEIKRKLLEDNDHKPSMERANSTTNLDDYYLRLAGGIPQKKDESEPEQGKRKTSSRINSNFKFDAVEIDALTISDNVSITRPKSTDDSQIMTKNFLNETGFSKFDALIGKHKNTNPLQKSGITAKNTLALMPQVSASINFENEMGFSKFDAMIGKHKFSQDFGKSGLKNTLGYIASNGQSINFDELLPMGTSNLDRKNVSQVELLATNDYLRKVNEKVTMDAFFLERMEKQSRLPSPRHSYNDQSKHVSQSAVTYGRSSHTEEHHGRSESSPDADLKSEIIASVKKDSVAAKFTSFKGPQASENTFHAWSKDASINSNQMASPDSPDNSYVAPEEHTFQGITADSITEALQNHKMYKQSTLDLTGIIDGYLDWKWDEFKDQYFRFPNVIIPEKLALELLKTVSQKNEKKRDILNMSIASQKSSPFKKQPRRSVFNFSLVSYSITKRDGHPNDSMQTSFRDLSEARSSEYTNNPLENSFQIHPKKQPKQESATKITFQNVFDKSSIFTLDDRRKANPQQKLKQVEFIDKIPKNSASAHTDRVFRNSHNTGPHSFGVPQVNPSIFDFKKSHQGILKQAERGSMTPTPKINIQHELYPSKIGGDTGFGFAKQIPQVYRNSFNEMTSDSVEKPLSPGKTYIRETMSTAAGNSQTVGDRSPPTMVIKGKHAQFVRQEGNALVYRYN